MRNYAGLLPLLCLAISCASSAAAAPLTVPFGRGIRHLQDLVDRQYGVGRIDVTRDFIGAREGDPDPWYWTGLRVGSARITILKRDPDQNLVGWYIDGGTQSVAPQGGGTLFSGQVRPHEEAWLSLSGTRMGFGFYIDAATVGPRYKVPERRRRTVTERFFTNRALNDCGIGGAGATHAPYDGDVQALVFDVSRWVGGDAWLVCFEDQDTGGDVVEEADDDDDRDGSGGRQRDDPDADLPPPRRSNLDFDDVVFEVREEGATPARPVSFGTLKLIYR